MQRHKPIVRCLARDMMGRDLFCLQTRSLLSLPAVMTLQAETARFASAGSIENTMQVSAGVGCEGFAAH